MSQSIPSSQNLGSQDSSVIRSIFGGKDDVDDDDDCLKYDDDDSDEGKNDDDAGDGDENDGDENDGDENVEIEEGEVLDDIMSNKQAFYKLRTDVYNKSQIKDCLASIFNTVIDGPNVRDMAGFKSSYINHILNTKETS
jgi:hypothetical protein